VDQLALSESCGGDTEWIELYNKKYRDRNADNLWQLHNPRQMGWGEEGGGGGGGWGTQIGADTRVINACI
jgi:hypothetical protein